MDFLIDGQISSFCPDQHEETSIRVDERILFFKITSRNLLQTWLSIDKKLSLHIYINTFKRTNLASEFSCLTLNVIKIWAHFRDNCVYECPFVSPSTIVNQHSHLHMVFLIGLLLGHNSVLIGGVYVWVVTSHVFCFNAIGWS